MRLVTYSMGTTVDGFMVGPDGGFDWGVPDPEVFEFHIEELRSTGTHLLGRKLYEVMLYWETAEQEGLLDEQRSNGRGCGRNSRRSFSQGR